MLPPIDLREELGGACVGPNEGYELVTGRMRDALHELDEARALPLIGLAGAHARLVAARAASRAGGWSRSLTAPEARGLA